MSERTHDLKTAPEHFQQLALGLKLFELVGLPPGTKYASRYSRSTPIKEVEPVFRLERSGTRVDVTIDTEPNA